MFLVLFGRFRFLSAEKNPCDLSLDLLEGDVIVRCFFLLDLTTMPSRSLPRSFSLLVKVSKEKNNIRSLCFQIIVSILCIMQEIKLNYM